MCWTSRKVRLVFVLVLFEMLRQVGDAVRQQRDLNLGAAGVAFNCGVLGNDLLLGISVD